MPPHLRTFISAKPSPSHIPNSLETSSPGTPCQERDLGVCGYEVQVDLSTPMGRVRLCQGWGFEDWCYPRKAGWEVPGGSRWPCRSGRTPGEGESLVKALRAGLQGAGGRQKTRAGEAWVQTDLLRPVC